jgi:hypothetical protein
MLFTVTTGTFLRSYRGEGSVVIFFYTFKPFKGYGCDRILGFASVRNSEVGNANRNEAGLSGGSRMLLMATWIERSAKRTTIRSCPPRFRYSLPPAYDLSAAPVFSHNELLIHAAGRHAFARLADAADWPNWFVLVKDVANETPGNSGQGALYRLKIFNSLIQCFSQWRFCRSQSLIVTYP